MMIILFVIFSHRTFSLMCRMVKLYITRTVITNVYIILGGGEGQPPSPRFSDSIHTVYDQILLSQLCSLLTFKALARQKIISLDSRNIIKMLAAKHPPPPSLCTAFCISHLMAPNLHMHTWNHVYNVYQKQCIAEKVIQQLELL